MVYPALILLMRTTRLPVVDWSDALCRFKWNLPFRQRTKSGFSACAITFQTQSALFCVVMSRSVVVTWQGLAVSCCSHPEYDGTKQHLYEKTHDMTSKERVMLITVTLFESLETHSGTPYYHRRNLANNIWGGVGASRAWVLGTLIYEGWP